MMLAALAWFSVGMAMSAFSTSIAVFGATRFFTGLALGVIEAVGMHFTSPSLKSLLSYGIFIAVLLWRPNGLFARK